MRKVVVTGYGIVSSLGNDVKAVTESLKNSASGISINEVNKELGLRSYISGSITVSYTHLTLPTILRV